MPNKKFSQLDEVTDVQAADDFALERAGVSKRITGASLTSELGGGSLPDWWTVDSTPGAESVDFAGVVSITPSYDTVSPLSLIAPESGNDGPFAIDIQPGGPAWTGGVFIDTGDTTNLQGNAYALRVYDSVNGRDILDIDAYGSFQLKALAAGFGGFVVRSGDGLGVFQVNAGADLSSSDIRIAGNTLAIDGAAGFVDMREQVEPAAPVVDTGRLFTQDVAGKTQLCVRFNTGASQVIATEP